MKCRVLVKCHLIYEKNPTTPQNALLHIFYLANPDAYILNTEITLNRYWNVSSFLASSENTNTEILDVWISHERWQNITATNDNPFLLNSLENMEKKMIQINCL